MYSVSVRLCGSRRHRLAIPPKEQPRSKYRKTGGLSERPLRGFLGFRMGSQEFSRHDGYLVPRFDELNFVSNPNTCDASAYTTFLLVGSCDLIIGMCGSRKQYPRYPLCEQRSHSRGRLTALLQPNPDSVTRCPEASTTVSRIWGHT